MQNRSSFSGTTVEAKEVVRYQWSCQKRTARGMWGFMLATLARETEPQGTSLPLHSVTLRGSDDSNLRKKGPTLTDGSRGRRAHHTSEGGEQAASVVLGAGSRENTALTTDRKQREWDRAVNFQRGKNIIRIYCMKKIHFHSFIHSFILCPFKAFYPWSKQSVHLKSSTVLIKSLVLDFHAISSGSSPKPVSSRFLCPGFIWLHPCFHYVISTAAQPQGMKSQSNYFCLSQATCTPDSLRMKWNLLCSPVCLNIPITSVVTALTMGENSQHS